MIYATGGAGTQMIVASGSKLNAIGSINSQAPGCSIEWFKNGSIAIQEPNTNNLILHDMNLTRTRKIDGNFEDGAGMN